MASLIKSPLVKEAYGAILVDNNPAFNVSGMPGCCGAFLIHSINQNSKELHTLALNYVIAKWGSLALQFHIPIEVGILKRYRFAD